MFEKKGVICIDTIGKSKDDLELLAIDAGADDFSSEENLMYLYTKQEDLEKTKKALEEKGIKIESSNLEWVPKENVTVDDETRERCEKFFEAIDEHDDVQNIFTNI
jgi:transcriptional/translational regulatory protein YebC/TACO1